MKQIVLILNKYLRTSILTSNLLIVSVVKANQNQFETVKIKEIKSLQSSFKFPIQLTLLSLKFKERKAGE